MSYLRRIIVLALVACGGGQLFSMAPARAGTPKATASPNVGAVPTATAQRGESMILAGTIWTDARPAGGLVMAYIGETECARYDAQIIAPDTISPLALLTIPPASQRAGCGTPGATVRFTVDGRPANETVRWAPGDRAASMMWTVGAPFAIYSGAYLPPSGLAGNVAPVIGGVVCGVQVNPALGSGPSYDFEVVVDSAARTPGCGTPGAVVRFRLDRFLPDGTHAPTAIFADQRVVWQPDERGTLDLTFARAPALPSSGDGDARPARAPWRPTAIALALLGTVALLLGAARARRMTR